MVELNEIQEKLMEKANRNELGMAYPVLSINSELIDAEVEWDPTSSQNFATDDSTPNEVVSIELKEDDDEDSEEDNWYDVLTSQTNLPIIISAGAFIILAVIIAIVLKKKCKKSVPIIQEPVKDGAETSRKVEPQSAPFTVGRIELMDPTADLAKLSVADLHWPAPMTPNTMHSADASPSDDSYVV